MRGATRDANNETVRQIISIHAPHAGSDQVIIMILNRDLKISIHAPHAGSDNEQLNKDALYGSISIHAPHAGSDPLIMD